MSKFDNENEREVVTIVKTQEEFLLNRAVSIANEDANPRPRGFFYRYFVERFRWAEAIRHTYKAATTNLRFLRWAAPAMLFIATLNIVGFFVGIFFEKSFDVMYALYTFSITIFAVYMLLLKRKSLAVIKSFDETEF